MQIKSSFVFLAATTMAAAATLPESGSGSTPAPAPSQGYSKGVSQPFNPLKQSYGVTNPPPFHLIPAGKYAGPRTGSRIGSRIGAPSSLVSSAADVSHQELDQIMEALKMLQRVIKSSSAKRGAFAKRASRSGSSHKGPLTKPNLDYDPHGVDPKGSNKYQVSGSSPPSSRLPLVKPSLDYDPQGHPGFSKPNLNHDPHGVNPKGSNKHEIPGSTKSSTKSKSK